MVEIFIEQIYEYLVNSRPEVKERYKDHKKNGTGQCCKRGSVPWLPMAPVIYPDLQSPAGSNDLPPRISGQLFIPFQGRPGIFGLSIHKVYPYRQLPDDTVGSYPTFSPLPVKQLLHLGGCFLWHWLFPPVAEPSR